MSEHAHECRDCGADYGCSGRDHWNGCEDFDGSCPDCHAVENTRPGLLPTGTSTKYGIIAESTLTAYKMADGSFVAFQAVHGDPRSVDPLVVLT